MKLIPTGNQVILKDITMMNKPNRSTTGEDVLWALIQKRKGKVIRRRQPNDIAIREMFKELHIVIQNQCPSFSDESDDINKTNDKITKLILEAVLKMEEWNQRQWQHINKGSRSTHKS